LGEAGFRVLRFWNNDVLQHTGAVVESIWKVLLTPTPPPP
jgi:very-short-patch-repair endonuclease